MTPAASPIERVAVGDGHLTVAATGDPDGPPLVLLPGLSDGLAPLFTPHGRRLLRPLPPALQRFRVLMVSYRDPLPATVETPALAADVAALLRARLARPAVVAAHSMGAMVAQHLAADHPELVDRLVLSATLARADDAFRSVLRQWDQLLAAGRWRAFYRDAVGRSYTRAGRRRRLAWLAVAPVPRPAHLVGRHFALSHAAVHHDATDRLAAIRAPALVLAGGADAVVHPRHAAALASAIPDARHELVPGYGHAFPEQAAGRFTAVVEAFLQDRTPT